MKYIRFFIAILLIPLLIGLLSGFYELIVAFSQKASSVAVPFWIGIASYFIFQIIFFRPIRTYVFGHELTHTLAGMLSGAKLKSFKVSATGGSVVLNKTNVWIALAPYFLPIYAITLVAIFWIGRLFWQFDKYYSYFLFASGFSLSFHLALTHFALSQGQSDLKQFGNLFSIVVILIINCIILAGLLKLIFPDYIDFAWFIKESVKKTEIIFSFLFRTLKVKEF